MTDETNVTPGPADKGGPTSESGAHDTNAGARSEDSDSGISLETVAEQLAKLGERLEGIDGRTRRQIDEIRRATPKPKADEPKADGGTGKPDSEIATLRKQLEEIQNQAQAERTRAAVADVFAAEDVRSLYADGALDLVRGLLAPQVSLNSEGVPVIDNGETQTPLSDAVKAYAKDKPFLRRPNQAQGTGASSAQSMGSRPASGGDIDWTKADPKSHAAKLRDLLGGDRI